MVTVIPMANYASCESYNVVSKTRSYSLSLCLALRVRLSLLLEMRLDINLGKAAHLLEGGSSQLDITDLAEFTQLYPCSSLRGNARRDPCGRYSASSSPSAGAT